MRSTFRTLNTASPYTEPTFSRSATAGQVGVQLVLIDSSYTTRHPLQLASATEGEAASCSY